MYIIVERALRLEANIREDDRKIEKYLVDDLGYLSDGSGMGFGIRDMSFTVPEINIPDFSKEKIETKLRRILKDNSIVVHVS